MMLLFSIPFSQCTSCSTYYIFRISVWKNIFDFLLTYVNMSKLNFPQSISISFSQYEYLDLGFFWHISTFPKKEIVNYLLFYLWTTEYSRNFEICFKKQSLQYIRHKVTTLYNTLKPWYNEQVRQTFFVHYIE